MNILLVNTLYSPFKVGGAEKSVQLLAEGLAEKGHSVTVATLHDKENIECNLLSGVNIVRIPLKNIYWPFEGEQPFYRRAAWHCCDIYNVGMLKTFISNISSGNFDVVHTNNLTGFSVSVWSWAKKNEIPIVHTSRDYSLIHPNGTLFKNGKNMSTNSLESVLYSTIKKKISKNVNVYIGISQYIKELHLNAGFFCNAKSDVIYNSIKERPFLKRERREIPVIGFLGRVEEEKGIEILLDAMTEMNNFIIKIAGKGESKYISYLKKKYPTLSADYLGIVDIDDFFPVIDYLVVPSLWNEPMGRVVLESSSYGIPVVGSSKGGIPEIIKDKQTGFIFNTSGSDTLKEVLKKVWMQSPSDYAAMSKAAWDYSCEFNSEIIVEKYINAYQLAIQV